MPLPPSNDEEDRPPGALRRWFSRAAEMGRAFDLRAQWWNLLDFIEDRPRLRMKLLWGLPALALLAAAAVFGYAHWSRANAARMARQWLDAGRLDRAAFEIRVALADRPDDPEVLQIASAVAWRGGQKALALDYARRAAETSHGDPTYTLLWAEAATLNGQGDEAKRAVAQLGPERTAASPRAERVLADVARQRRQWAEARDRFAAALALDKAARRTDLGVDEVPLGCALLLTGDPAERTRGLALLTRWSTDPQWGAPSLRHLLGDAMMRQDRPAMARWAQALMKNRRLSLGDMPLCLRALSLSDEKLFRSMADLLEKNYGPDSSKAAMLIGWLNQCGRSDEAILWARTLPEDRLSQPPLAVALADSLQQAHRWSDLLAWTQQGTWGPQVDFLRWAYALDAARELGDKAQTEAASKKLADEASRDVNHLIVAADVTYAWGLRDTGVALLWQAANQQSGAAMLALWTLAKHYQKARDAEGQYRAFYRLYLLRSRDPGIANNLAYFAALTGEGSRSLADQITRENLAREPGNPTFLATRAFVLCTEQKAPEALALIQPAAARWPDSAAVALAYGLALADTGHRDEARPILERFHPADLTTREVALIRAALQMPSAN